MTSIPEPKAILERLYSTAIQEVKKDGGKSSLSLLNKSQREWLNTIVAKGESLKAVLTVLITSLLKKIENPNQDIRLHKEEFDAGYSGRTFDTKYVTPFMKSRFRRLSMKESGWLTRSIEQPHPFTRDFPGKIRDTRVKDSFLRILEDVEGKGGDPEKYLIGLFVLLIQHTTETSDLHDIVVGSRDATIDRIMMEVKEHFSANYGVSGASRLPVVAIYSIYQCLLEDIARYSGKKVLPLRSHTTSDLRARGVGDIEVIDETGQFFEAVEIKHRISITSQLVEDAFGKFRDTPIKRYYLLTTADPYVRLGEEEKVRKAIRRIRIEHGCEVIVNGILSTLKYYLRLVNEPRLFMERYSKNLETEFSETSDIKEEHIRKWKSIREGAAESGN